MHPSMIVGVASAIGSTFNATASPSASSAATTAVASSASTSSALTTAVISTSSASTTASSSVSSASTTASASVSSASSASSTATDDATVTVSPLVHAGLAQIYADTESFFHKANTTSATSAQDPVAVASLVHHILTAAPRAPTTFAYVPSKTSGYQNEGLVAAHVTEAAREGPTPTKSSSTTTTTAADTSAYWPIVPGCEHIICWQGLAETATASATAV